MRLVSCDLLANGQRVWTMPTLHHLIFSIISTKIIIYKVHQRSITMCHMRQTLQTVVFPSFYWWRGQSYLQLCFSHSSQFLTVSPSLKIQELMNKCSENKPKQNPFNFMLYQTMRSFPLTDNFNNIHLISSAALI